MSSREIHTPTNRAGTVATTASAKTIDTIMGGLFGSSRKMWWISGNLPYRRAGSYCGVEAMGSSWTSMLKRGVADAAEEPNEPRTRLAVRGALERRNCTGRSFWVCSC